MESFRFADNLEGEAVIALGLPAARLVLVGLGGALSWGLAELPLPVPLRLTLAALLALCVAALAWGRAQGESLARWAWLALGFWARAVAARRTDRSGWASAEQRGAELPPLALRTSPSRVVVFVSPTAGSGCSTLCRATLGTLVAEGYQASGGAEGPWTVTPPEVGRLGETGGPALIVSDLGTHRPAIGPEPPAALVLVWDGKEGGAGEFEAQLAQLEGLFRTASVLVALNRAGPATGIARRIAATGARLVAAIPVDGQLGRELTPAEPAIAGPAAEGVRTLAGAVLSAARLG